ncbi:hypothetical protein K6U58_09790 [Vibrio fluvialis]|uniref:hypothetical protein n=1 Tax=Vibrio fluvialis TaxID=676 RepID=UPI001EEC24D9|nr:hypothetical protein [Vibrio fluvialis]ELV8682587.1 hypothetical protein [Vibrio fluvialis]MCG6358883.1 hypothetical protein [Vibrio fluvialis]
MKKLSKNHSEYSVSITLEEMARQTCLPLAEAKAAIKELEKRNLITVVRKPLSAPRYIINLKEIERQAGTNRTRGA